MESEDKGSTWISFVATPFWNDGLAGTLDSSGLDVIPNESDPHPKPSP